MEIYLEKRISQNLQKIQTRMKSERKEKTTLSVIFLCFFAHRIREKAPVREPIHSDGVLNVYPVDTSTILSGGQDRVFIHFPITHKNYKTIIYIEISFI